MPDNNELLATVLQQQTEALKELAAQMHEKTPATTATNTPLHGSAGIFVGPGLERDVITAHVRPVGIAKYLPLMPSVDEDPRFGALTGYTATSGSQPTNACDDAPTGYVKGCNLTSRFGRVRYDTQTIEMDKVMLRVNRGDFTDLVLRGRVLGMNNVGPRGLTESDILNIVTKSEMVTAGVAFERELTRQIWQGTVAVANEFPGLDVQIATGQKDADTGTLCPALDSDVKSYNYAMISATIVNYITMIEKYLRWNAETMGLAPVEWIIAMRPELWHELSAIWPCAYNTTKCGSYVESGGSVTVDGREMVAIRDSMRQQMYLDINGRRYTVVEDSGIFEHNSTNNANLLPGQFASSIYFLPLSIIGNFPVTYRQYVDYSRASADISLLRGKEDFWTDGGAYSWALEQIKWCYKLAAKTEQRVILRTPQLAGRIDAVGYEPLQHLRDPMADSPYFADGGVSLRTPIGTPYAVWDGR